MRDDLEQLARATAPDPSRVNDIVREHRALYLMCFAEDLGAVEGKYGPQLGPVGYTLILGGGLDGHFMLVKTDLDMHVTESQLLLLPPTTEPEKS